MMRKYFFCCMLCIPLLAAGQSLQVLSVFPPPNDNTASGSTSIRVDFNLPIDTSGIEQQFVILGNMRALYDFTAVVDPSLQMVTLYPDIPFLIGERLEVIVRSSLTGSGGEAFNGFNWNFKIKPTFATPPYFTPPIIFGQFNGSLLLPTDINDDSFIDLILVGPVVQVVINDGQGGFSLNQQFNNALFNPELPVTDLDLDGFKDLIVATGFYEQGSDGLFHFTMPLEVAIADIRDMNRDGYPDIITDDLVADDAYLLGIQYNDGLGHFGPIDTLLTDSLIVGAVTGDFNNDGINDIAYITQIFATPGGVGGHNSLRVVYMASDGDTLYRNVYNEQSFPSGDPGMAFRILSADFDNDGYADILLQTNAEDLLVFNDTQGGFQTMTPEVTGGGDLYHWDNSGDVNGDGWLDLVNVFEIGLREFASNGYMLNSPNGFGGGGAILQRENAGIASSIVADFDNDGAQDVATTWFDGLFIHFNRNVQGVESPPGSVPQGFALQQNYPNPFNGETLAPFYLPKGGNVESIIYDISGKEVKRFPTAFYPAGEGRLKWDARNNNGKEVSSGVYFWKFKFQGVEQSIKVILIH